MFWPALNIVQGSELHLDHPNENGTNWGWGGGKEKLFSLFQSRSKGIGMEGSSLPHGDREQAGSNSFHSPCLLV